MHGLQDQRPAEERPSLLHPSSTNRHSSRSRLPSALAVEVCSPLISRRGTSRRAVPPRPAGQAGRPRTGYRRSTDNRGTHDRNRRSCNRESSGRARQLDRAQSAGWRCSRYRRTTHRTGKPSASLALRRSCSARPRRPSPVRPRRAVESLRHAAPPPTNRPQPGTGCRRSAARRRPCGWSSPDWCSSLWPTADCSPRRSMSRSACVRRADVDGCRPGDCQVRTPAPSDHSADRRRSPSGPGRRWHGRYARPPLYRKRPRVGSGSDNQWLVGQLTQGSFTGR